MSWLVGTVREIAVETPNARTLTIDVPDWPGNLAGQHLDLRLTAEDGYQAARSYSLASAGGSPIELTVDEIRDGEVSPYLVRELRVGDQIELRGPIGNWFLWTPDRTAPVQLIGGGSGCVPLAAMARAHHDSGSAAEMRLLYSVRAPEFVFYRDELDREADGGTLDLTIHYTRKTPEGWPLPPARLTRERLAEVTIPVDEQPEVYICGPTPFVEAVADWMVDLGHPPARVKTERFGGG